MLTKMCKNVQRFSKSAPNCPFRGKRNSKTNFLCIALLHIYPCLLSFDVLLEQVHRPNAHFRQYLSRISCTLMSGEAQLGRSQLEKIPQNPTTALELDS